MAFPDGPRKILIEHHPVSSGFCRGSLPAINAVGFRCGRMPAFRHCGSCEAANRLNLCLLRGWMQLTIQRTSPKQQSVS